MSQKPTYAELEQRVRELERAASERNRKEEITHDSPELLSFFLKHSPIYAFLKKVSNKDSKVIYVSDNYIDMIGIPASQMTGKTMDELFPHEFAEKITKDDIDVINNGINLKLHEELNDRHYITYKFPLIQASKKYLAGYTIDITDLKKTEELLAKSEERFRTLFEEAPLPYQSLDENGCVMEVSRRWTEMLGYLQDEVIGKSFAEFLHPDWVDHFRENFPMVKSVENLLGGEFQLKKKDGTYAWVQFDETVRFDSAGAVVQTHCVFNDITEQRILQKKFKAQEEAIRRTERMESVGMLAGGIAHDFNNILSIILGNNEMIADQVSEYSQIRANTEEIQIAGLRARDVVRQLLSFSRHDDTTKNPLDLQAVARESFRLIRSTMPASISLELQINEEVPNILGNITQINQVLINLCANAKDAVVESGGTITIELANESLYAESPFADQRISPGNYVRLSVSDDGCGMGVKTLERMFDPYFTTKEIGRGTGIGLSVVHGIVERHGGAISVDSKPGKGTIISILLPACEKQSEPIEDTTRTLTTGSERILLVDDEASLLRLGTIRLEKLGYEVTSTTDPKEALALFKDGPEDFDLLVTDMAMPKMTGEELAFELMQIRPDMPIILCTGYSENISREEAMKIGIREFVMKPLENYEFAALIRKVLEHVKS